MPYKNKQERNKYSRERTARIRSNFFQDKKCSWCGKTERLVLHHLDKSTKLGSAIWSWSEKRRVEEISKCIILCDSCHIKHHSNEKRRFIHGIASTYKKGCRCVPCREAQYATQHTKRNWYKPSFDFSNK